MIILKEQYTLKFLDCHIFKLQFVGLHNFHPLEVVGRDCETQLQVGENLYFIIYRI